MDSDIISAITTVGFPIVCCLIVMYFCKYVFDKYREDINGLRESLDNNTHVISELTKTLEKDHD